MESGTTRTNASAASFSELLQEQPLLLGLLGIGLGAAIGAALPSTQKENELLGETRDRALDRMKSVGSEQVEKVRQTVNEAIRNGKDYQAEFRLVRADGSVGWVCARGAVQSAGSPVVELGARPRAVGRRR